MKDYSADKPKKKKNKRYNSFEHRVLANLRRGKDDYIFDMEHMHKIKRLLAPNESIFVDVISGCYFIRMATEKERQKDFQRHMEVTGRKTTERALNDYNMQQKLIWADRKNGGERYV